MSASVRCNPCEAEIFPPSGIPEYPVEHDYPTRWTIFHWWGKPVSNKVCYRTIRRDELPIPPIHEERWRYPYRYSSAGPALSGQRISRVPLDPAIKRPRKTYKLTPRDIRQIKGFETTSMDASTEPFMYHPPTEIVIRRIPPTMLTPTWAPRIAHSDFGQYVLNQLHPNHRRDPRILKRIHFHSVDANRELCSSLRESEHLQPKPQRKIKKKDFLFVQQRPGHRAIQDLECGATAEMPI